MDTDRAWERFGDTDPYFGVLSDATFRDAQAEGEARRDFFRSGDEHVETFIRIIRDSLDPEFAPRRALDFGCGVGRVAIPLARRIPEVIGMDVSSSMLREARRNCEAAGVQNVSLLKSDDRLSALKGDVDFVHSFIVFQHIRPARGEKLVRTLLRRLRSGGFGALHFTYAKRIPRWRRTAQAIRSRVPLAHGVGNLLQRRPFRHPLMEMNDYDINRLLLILQEHDCHRVHLRFSDHGGYLGVILFFHRESLPLL